MKKLIISGIATLAVLVTLGLSLPAEAKYSGGRSSFSSRPSISRSYAKPSYSRPSVTPRATPSYQPRTQVIERHHYTNNNSGGMDAMSAGMLGLAAGTMMNSNHSQAAPIIVNTPGVQQAQPQVVQQPIQQAPVEQAVAAPVEEDEGGSGWVLFTLVLIGGGVAYFIYRKKQANGK